MRRGAVGVGLTVALVAAGTLAAAPARGQSPVTVPFTALGTHSFTVPAGICQVTVDVRGAQGGSTVGVDSAGLKEKLQAQSSGSPSPDDQAKAQQRAQQVGTQATGTGGLGGEATATLPVTPGEVLTITVGQHGGDAGSSTPNAGAPDGGTGGNGETSGAGGGGSSDVRQGGTDLAHRVVVAGGGGGAGFGFTTLPGPGVVFEDGGGGGGTNGQTGDPPGPSPFSGQGGTQSAGGDGGDVSFPFSGSDGDDGALATGGNGASGFLGGGGGGGGFYGGGGGSSSVLDDIFAFGDPGGGGSGFGPAATVFSTGVNTGSGSVTVAYDPDNSGCAVAVARFTG